MENKLVLVFDIEEKELSTLQTVTVKTHLAHHYYQPIIILLSHYILDCSVINEYVRLITTKMQIEIDLTRIEVLSTSMTTNIHQCYEPDIVLIHEF